MLNYESDKFALAFRAAHAAEPSLCVASCLVRDRESMPARSLLAFEPGTRTFSSWFPHVWAIRPCLTIMVKAASRLTMPLHVILHLWLQPRDSVFQGECFT